jgi:glycosyltransferase involved in cell wall biosynthesis
MRIDVVIATYNRGDCIGAAVDSVLEYREDIGVIYVVVNGSTDNTLDNLKIYENNSQVIIVNIKNNLGAPAGKNIGMKKSDAEVIVIIDDDAVFFYGKPNFYN